MVHSKYLGRALLGAVIAGFLAAGCAPKKVKLHPAVEECWQVSRELLRSPSTAELIKSSGEGDPDVFVTIDAANAYGTPVRSLNRCEMAEADGVWTVTAVSVDGQAVDPYALAAALLSRATTRAQEAMAKIKS